MAIKTLDVMSKVEDILDQLEKSWPKTFETILEKYPLDEFYIYTFVKKNMKTVPGTVTVYHQPRQTKPDPLAETILRKVNKKAGTVETIWALPHQEAVNLFKDGKLFADKEVFHYIQKFQQI